MGKDPELQANIAELQRSVFVLETAYVSAFSDESDTVIALGVVAKNGERVGPLRFLNQEIRLGEDSIADIMDEYQFGTKFTAGCGARFSYFYEATIETPGAMNYRNVAAGVTGASTTRSDWFPDLRIACGPSTEFIEMGASDDFAAIADREKYLAVTGALRAETVADSVYITAPGGQITMDMIWLHPDELSAVDPWETE